MIDHPRMHPDPDLRIERTLIEALGTPAMSEESFERLRKVVAGEWRAAIAATEQTQSWRSRWAALAAAAALAAVSASVWVAKPTVQPVSIGSMSRLATGGLEVRSGYFQQRRLKIGDLLRVGDRFTTLDPLLVTLKSGGTLRIAAGTSLGIVGSAQLMLERGQIYLDIPSGSSANPLRVATRVGVVEHVGTEFEVMSDDQAVRVRVREGRIRFHATAGTVVADAGTELLAAPGKTIERRSIDTYGGDWLWTVALAPDYEIEGRSLIGFLTWVSRELGRTLDFADANARQIADRTILHGSVHDQLPLDAMSNVLAATSLSYEIHGDTIWVRSGP